MKETVGRKFRRALHFDFHTAPGIDNIFGNFDADRFAQQLENAHIEYVNITARCNMGYSYYNTTVGKKYAGMGERDVLAETVAACRKHSIGVSAYINVGLCHEFAADNPGWLKIDRHGRIYLDDKKDNFFRMMCYNSPYREHFLSEVREICEYDIDGLFVDCFMLRECFCPKCMADMARRGVDISDNYAVMSYQNTVREEFATEIRNAAGDKKDKIKFYFNVLPWTTDDKTHAEIECLSSDPAWGYDFFDSMAAYTRTKYRDRVYMSGRFQNSWGDFGGIKPTASMQNDLYDAMMNSFGISFGDHLHPIDGFENEVASRIETVMAEKLLYEPYTDNSENVVEAGIIIRSNSSDCNLPQFAKGAARMLKELKIQYNIYDENGCFENDNVKLLILGSDAYYGEDFDKRLCSFVKNGGKVIFSGSACDTAERLGLLGYAEIIGKDTADNAYYKTADSDMRRAVYLPSRIIKNISGKQEAAYVGNIVNFTWDGRQSCYYRPQGEVTQYSAVITDGRTACICFDIFKAYAENLLIEHRDLVKRLTDALLPEKLIEAPQMPKTATAAITDNGKYTVLHVKTTYPEIKMGRGLIEEHVYGRSVPVSLKGEYKVYKLPEMTEIDSRTENGRTLFETGEIIGYKAFGLEALS